MWTIKNITWITILTLISCHTRVHKTKVENLQTSQTQMEDETQKIMAVFAHPDDELTVAPVLSRYVREGKDVVLVICTDGRLGVNDHSGLEAGDGLAKIRQGEMTCSAEQLGVRLIHLDYHDQLKAAGGYDSHMPVARSLIQEIHHIFERERPDVVITFGPDGGSNHMDHRLIGSTVSAVFVNKNWVKPRDLYFVASPSNAISDTISKRLRGVDEEYLSARIAFEVEDRESAIEAIKCHKSQFQMQSIEKGLRQRYAPGAIFFRRLEKSDQLAERL